MGIKQILVYKLVRLCFVAGPEGRRSGTLEDVKGQERTSKTTGLEPKMSRNSRFEGVLCNVKFIWSIYNLLCVFLHLLYFFLLFLVCLM